MEVHAVAHGMRSLIGMGAAAARLGFSAKYERLFAEYRQEATKGISALLCGLLALCWSVNIFPVLAQQILCAASARTDRILRAISAPPPAHSN